MTIPNNLTMLFDNCFHVGAIPTVWKYAKVTPLPKGGNSQPVSNYRPISLLPLLSKLIEKIVHARIDRHLMQYDLLDYRHGGFRPGYSTVKTCTYFTNDIYTVD